MQGAWLAAALLVTVAWTGCLGTDEDEPVDGTSTDDADGTDGNDADGGSDDDPDSPPPDDASGGPGAPAPPTSVPLWPASMTYTGCSEQVGIFPYPMAGFEGLLPEGFQLRPFDPAGLLATFLMVGYSCGEATGAAAASDVSEMWGFLDVIPPDEYTDDGVTFYLFPLGAFVAADTQPVWSAWGLGDETLFGDAEVSFSLVTEDEPARIGRVTGDDGAGTTITLDTAALGPVEAGPAGVLRIFVATDGVATGAIDMAWSEAQVIANGVAVSEFPVDPLVWGPPISPGLALQVWGDEYTYVFTYAPLAPLSASEEPAPAPTPGLPVSMRL